jgi:hypothetical protein
MPTIEKRFEFEPKASSLGKWMGTRKAPFDCGGVRFPGYFSTANYDTDKAWFVLAAAIELIAIGIILNGGVKKGGLFLAGAIIAALIMILFDWVGAKWMHDKKDEVNKLRNNLLLAKGAAEQNEVKRKISSNSMTGKVIAGFLLILLSAVLKIASLFLLASFDFLLIGIMSILYMLVIYVHVAHTGYFLIERSLLKSNFPQDFNAWTAERVSIIQRAEGREQREIQLSTLVSEALVRQHNFTSELRLNMMNDVIRVGSHTVEFKNEAVDGSGDPVFHYLLTSKGILLDSDILLLTNGNSGRRAEIIGKACLELQKTVALA